MEWEMEREFEHEEMDDFNVSDFPDVVSEFDSGPFRSDLEMSGHGRNASLTATEMDINDVEVECHSEFSDESDEDAVTNAKDVSPTSPSDFATLQQLSSSDDGLELTSASIIKAHRGRRSGVQARLGTYEDVRNEMPPNPPLVALSPPPARLRTGKENAVGPSTAEVRPNGTSVLLNVLVVAHPQVSWSYWVQQTTESSQAAQDATSRQSAQLSSSRGSFF